MTAARIVVLGAAAGGGLPQWNCGCVNCEAARNGKIPEATQSSIAVSADGDNWLIINASPDIRHQLMRSEHLHPPKSLRRGSPVKSVLVTNGDIDHVAGLLILREKQPFELLATAHIHEVFQANSMFEALDVGLVKRRTIALEKTFVPVEDVEAQLFAVPGKVPLYLEEGEVDTKLVGEQTVGVQLRLAGKLIFYIPGCSMLTPDLLDRIQGADVLMFDGTVWENDEMPRLGVGEKTGARMGHMSMHGPEGSMNALHSIGIKRRIFVHLNNTNPVWQPESAERALARDAGWEIAHDGMEVVL